MNSGGENDSRLASEDAVRVLADALRRGTLSFFCGAGISVNSGNRPASSTPRWPPSRYGCSLRPTATATRRSDPWSSSETTAPPSSQRHPSCGGRRPRRKLCERPSRRNADAELPSFLLDTAGVGFPVEEI